jgi:hypothetical protein
MGMPFGKICRSVGFPDVYAEEPIFPRYQSSSQCSSCRHADDTADNAGFQWIDGLPPLSRLVICGI